MQTKGLVDNEVSSASSALILDYVSASLIAVIQFGKVKQFSKY